MNFNYQYDQAPVDLSTAPSSSNFNSSFWNRSTPNQNQINAPTGNNNTFNHQQYTQPQPQQQLSSVEEDKLRLKLRIKENEIETLENENQRLHESLALIEKRTSTRPNDTNINQLNQQVIPSTLNEIFVKLSANYEKVVQELNDTKLRLESLVMAYTLNPTNSVTMNGRHDELEVSHKILIKLENLKKENEELLKQFSFGKIKQLDMSFNLLKDENEQLKLQNKLLLEKVQKLESKSKR